MLKININKSMLDGTGNINVESVQLLLNDETIKRVEL